MCLYLLARSFIFILPSSRKELSVGLQKIPNSISKNEGEGLKWSQQ